MTWEMQKIFASKLNGRLFQTQDLLLFFEKIHRKALFAEDDCWTATLLKDKRDWVYIGD